MQFNLCATALKQCLAIITLAILTLTVACNRNANDSQGSKPFRVAVVVPGSTADQGWNYSAKQGAEQIQKELQLTEPVSFIENVEQSQRKPVLRDYGREGYSLVICHGYEFHQNVKEVAPEFPATTYIVSGYDLSEKDFGSIVYQLGQAAYLCGAIAARVTQTGHVGFIAAQPVPPVRLCHLGFKNGFLKYRSDGTVRPPVYIEGTHPWEDSVAAKDKTTALLRAADPKPIDVLFQNADAASRGIFEAVQQHDGRIFVFGCNRDQNDTTATTKVLASAVIHVDRAFVRAAKAVRDGTYKPHVESETVKSGVIDCVLNPKLNQLVGKETAESCQTILEQARIELIEHHVDPYAE